jgi:hypothetical protein
LVIYAVEQKRYATVPFTGNIDKVLDFVEERTGTDFPLADLLTDDPGKRCFPVLARAAKSARQQLTAYAVVISFLSNRRIWMWSCGSKTTSSRCRAASS